AWASYPSPPRQRCFAAVAQRARRGLRIALKRERRDHGDAVRAGGDGLAGIAGVDAGDRAQGKLRRTPAENGRDASQAGWADRGIGIVLGRGRKHAADPGIIDETDRRRFRLRDRLYRQPDDRGTSEQSASILDRHVVLSDMHAVGAAGKRYVDAIVDQQGNFERRERGLDRARAPDHRTRAAAFVPQLHQRGAALRDLPRQLGEVVTAGPFGIDQGIKSKIERHRLNSTRARARKVARSRVANASTISTAKVTGARARAAAHSPAIAKAKSPAAVASQASPSTARQAAATAAPAQPVAVTCPIRGSTSGRSARIVCGARISCSLRRHDPDQVRWVGSIASQPDGASAGHPIEIARRIYGFIAHRARADIRPDAYGMPGTLTRIL